MIPTKSKKAPAKTASQPTKKKQSSTKSASIFFKSLYEYVPSAELKSVVPVGVRGLYMLFMADGKHMNLVYVGMTGNGARGRVEKHIKTKKGWSHCSVYEVWDNISVDQIWELEALFRHALKRDSQAIGLNKQRRSAMWGKVKEDTKDRNSGLSKTQAVATSGPRPKRRTRA